MNPDVDAHSGAANMCSHEIREWRRKGTRNWTSATAAFLKAYIQIHVRDRFSLTDQAVLFQGRMKFGQNVATVQAKAKDIHVPYADDRPIHVQYIHESLVSVRVRS